jgi:hypothetical protein
MKLGHERDGMEPGEWAGLLNAGTLYGNCRLCVRGPKEERPQAEGRNPSLEPLAAFGRRTPNSRDRRGQTDGLFRCRKCLAARRDKAARSSELEGLPSPLAIELEGLSGIGLEAPFLGVAFAASGGERGASLPAYLEPLRAQAIGH